MSESGDYDPGPWTGHDFGTARDDYDRHAGRSYENATTSGKTLKDLIPKFITTDCGLPLIIITDETDSMQDWPAVMFSKMPWLDKEGREYIGEDGEISFMAIGDANSGRHDGSSGQEDYPLQVRPFAKGLELKERIKELVLERKGGGQTYETYEIGALYCLHRVRTPKAIHKPVIIFIGDEQPYHEIHPDNAERLVGVKIEKPIKTSEVFKKLLEKFSVYLVRKPYERVSGDSMSPADRQIFNNWADLIGVDHIAPLAEAQRVVDVILGILAKETERIEYFRKEMEGRQSKDQQTTVFKSLHTIHTSAEANLTEGRTQRSGKSIIRRGGGKPVADDDEDTMKPLL